MCRCGFCFKYGEVFIEERNYLFYSDAYSLYFGISAFLGGGVTGSVEIGYMKGEGNGWFFAYSGGVGTGVDLSVGGGFKISNYSGSEPMTINSYGGEGTSISAGYKYLEGGYSFSEDGNWKSSNVGISGGLTDLSGSVSHTFTNVK